MVCNNYSGNKLYNITNLTGTPLDYFYKVNWLKQDDACVHEVDLVYIYPTEAMVFSDGSEISGYDEEYRDFAQFDFKITASAFEFYTNVYAPYYRQVTIDKVKKLITNKNFINFKKESCNSMKKIVSLVAVLLFCDVVCFA